MKTLRSLLALTVLSASFAGAASADDVRIRSTYPMRFGEYEDVTVENEFTMGSPAAGALANVYGDITVNGDLVVTKPTNCRFIIAPKMGPNQKDVFCIDEQGRTSISYPMNANVDPRVKVSTVLIGKDFYAWGDPTDTPSVVGIMHGFMDPDITNTDPHLRRKGQFSSRPAGSPALDPTTGAYAPLRMDGREIQFGVEYQFRADDTSAGLLSRVLIGTLVPYTPPVVTPQPEVFLQVGQPLAVGDPALTTPDARMAGVDGVTPGLITPPGGAGSGWRIFSSREYKKDIVPLTPAQWSAALDDIARTDVVRYRFNGEPSTAALHTGVIAEDLPEAIRSPGGKSLNLTEAYAYAAAALKALKTENDSLKARLASLEARAEAGS